MAACGGRHSAAHRSLVLASQRREEPEAAGGTSGDLPQDCRAGRAAYAGPGAGPTGTAAGIRCGAPERIWRGDPANLRARGRGWAGGVLVVDGAARNRGEGAD